MDFGSIYHRTSDNYCYPLNEYDLIINENDYSYLKETGTLAKEFNKKND